MSDHAYLTQVDLGSNTNKHYFVAVVPRGTRGYEVMTAWGRIGTIGGEKSLGLYSNAFLAKPVFDKAVRMKERGGYTLTPMWPSHCPTWFTALPSAPGVTLPNINIPPPPSIPRPAVNNTKADELTKAAAREEELRKKKKERARWNF